MSGVTVVICAYTERRWEQLKRAVSSARSQTVPAQEVVVVIDHNSDLFRRACAELDADVIENAGRRGLSDARNTAIQLISDGIVAFLDDDAHFAPDWIERIGHVLEDPTVMAVGGRADAEWEAGRRPGWFPAPFDWVVGCSYEGMPTTLAPVRNLMGCNMAFRRSVFDQVGEFPADMGRVGTRPVGCEETELCIRIGSLHGNGSILHDPEAAVGHSVPVDRANWRYFISRCFFEGVSKAEVVRRAGLGSGLSSERAYTTRVLPRAVVNGFGDVITRRDAWGAARAAFVIVGFTATTVGYMIGQFSGAKSNNRTLVHANIEAG